MTNITQVLQLTTYVQVCIIDADKGVLMSPNSLSPLLGLMEETIMGNSFFAKQ